MPINPTLRELGFGPADRVAIVHADDIGMFETILPAFAELISAGLVTSGSIMVPCRWFSEAAVWCSKSPQADIGVHLTLTCEWENDRWGPLSTHNPATGLIDAEGCFHRTVSALWIRTNADNVRVEAQMQLSRARNAGIEPTHIDCHMFGAMDRRFVSEYVQIAFQQRLPCLLVREWSAWQGGMDHEIREWEQLGLPVFDSIRIIRLDHSPAHLLMEAKKIFCELPSGLSCVLLHPAQKTPALRASAPDWRGRVANYEVFMNRDLLNNVRDSGVQLIGYRALLDVMRKGAQARHGADV